MAFSKTCNICKKDFSSLIEYMDHLKKDHKDVPRELLGDIGKEQRWGFREEV